MCTTNSKFLETTPNGSSVILDKFKDHQSDASLKITQSRKHRAFCAIFSEVLKLTPNCSKWSKYTMSWRIFGNIIELVGQSGKHGIFDGISWNLLKMYTTNSKFLVAIPISLSIILVKFEDHQSKNFAEFFRKS